MGHLIIVGGHNIKKKSVSEISIIELLRLKSACAQCVLLVGAISFMTGKGV